MTAPSNDSASGNCKGSLKVFKNAIYVPELSKHGREGRGVLKEWVQCCRNRHFPNQLDFTSWVWHEHM